MREIWLGLIHRMSCRGSSKVQLLVMTTLKEGIYFFTVMMETAMTLTVKGAHMQEEGVSTGTKTMIV